MRNKIIFIQFILLTSFQFLGQQLPNYVNQNANRAFSNPSFLTFSNSTEVLLAHKLTQNSFSLMPMTNFGQFKTVLRGKHGFGVSLLQSQRGIFKEFNGYLSYGYSVKLNGYWKMGFGLSGGLKNQSLNLNESVYFQNDDPFLTANSLSSNTYDGQFGYYLSSSKFLFHFSIMQLFGNRFNNNLSNLNQHYVAGLEYKFSFPKNLSFTPMASVNYVQTGLSQYNLGGQIEFKNTFGIGMMAKSDFILSPSFYVKYKSVELSYAYDLISLNDINQGLGHEIAIKWSKPKYNSMEKNITKEVALEEILELIDSYFDVQTSDIDIIERKKLLNDLRNQINELLPYLDVSDREKIEKDLNTKKKKPKKKKLAGEK
jgi:type IX secretion system PorP/SprF family membrane protein